MQKHPRMGNAHRWLRCHSTLEQGLRGLGCIASAVPALRSDLTSMKSQNQGKMSSACRLCVARLVPAGAGGDLRGRRPRDPVRGAGPGRAAQQRPRSARLRRHASGTKRLATLGQVRSGCSAMEYSKHRAAVLWIIDGLYTVWSRSTGGCSTTLLAWSSAQGQQSFEV